MGIGYQARRPEEAFADHVDGLLTQFEQQLRATGNAGRPVEATVRVTDLADEQVTIVRERAEAAGLARIILVDDHRPSRPGTVPSALLGPEQHSSLADARAARILGPRP
jgi:hypothetical protein